MQRLADTHPVKARILVRGILRRFEPRIFDDLRQLCAPPADQRADQRQSGARHLPARAHPGEPGDPAAAIEPHQQGLCLIIGMMRGGQGGEPAILHPSAQRGVTRGARLVLQIAARNLYIQDAVRNAIGGA